MAYHYRTHGLPHGWDADHNGGGPRCKWRQEPSVKPSAAGALLSLAIYRHTILLATAFDSPLTFRDFASRIRPPSAGRASEL